MRLKIELILLEVFLLIISATTIKGETGISVSRLIHSKPDSLINNLWIKVDAFDLNIPPPSSGIQFYRDGIVYLSDSKDEVKMLYDHQSFGETDARYAILNESTLDKIFPFSADRKFKYPCEAVTFTSDFNTMYFTKYTEKDGVEKIYKATYIPEAGTNGSWTLEENPLDFCSGKSIYTHPALSNDGKLMIFASNRSGSIGGMDLFVSQEKEGIWSEPVNLGDAVNSQGNELYPYLDIENNLYFSSDGIEGFGGYDIYVCRFKSNTWEKPINLSAPVNTMFDDVAFTINRSDGKSAFYTVKQNDGKRSLQLYKVEMNSAIPDTLLNLSQYFTRPDISRMVILVLEPAVQATDRRVESVSSKRSKSSGENIITYRVQFMTSFNPGTRDTIVVEGNKYNVFEHLYSGAYRLCVGEFSTLSPAIELQNLLRKNDYPRASVVAFKDGILSLDPELLRGTESVPSSEISPTAETLKSEKPEESAAGTTKIKEPEVKALPAVAAASVPVIKQPETVKAEVPVSETKKDEVVYRIQFQSNSKSRGSFGMTIAGKEYNTFEYQYAGAYRTTVGEFSTLSEATEFQRTVRQSGYPQAFVVAFKNNVRSTDPNLFK